MQEDTDQLVRNAQRMLAEAAAVNDDALLAPNASALADSAAYLCQQGDESARATLRRYLGLAARHAQSTADLPACAGFYRRLAETCPENDSAHWRALLDAARALSRTGRYGEALPLLEHIAQLAAKDQRTLHSARILMAAPLSEAGRPADALALMCSVIDESKEPAVRGAAAVNGALAALVLGKPGRTLELAQLALQWCADEPSKLRARQALASALTARGEYSRALEQLREVAAQAAQVGDRALVGATLGNIGGVLLATGDIHAGRLELERAYEIFLELGDANSIANTCINLGVSLIEEGYPEQAQRHLLHAAEEFSRLGDAAHRSNARLNFAEACVLSGQYERARQALKSEQACEHTQDEGLRCYWHAVSAAVDAAAGRVDEARAHYARVMTLAADSGRPDELARAAAAAAELEYRQGRWREAASLSDRAVEALKNAGAVPTLLLVDALITGARAASHTQDRAGMQARLLRALELADELPLLAKSEGPRAKALIGALRELEAQV
jgi:tetratricopeptide (TPR) repeat protein